MFDLTEACNITKQNLNISNYPFSKLASLIFPLLLIICFYYKVTITIGFFTCLLLLYNDCIQNVESFFFEK